MSCNEDLQELAVKVTVALNIARLGIEGRKDVCLVLVFERCDEVNTTADDDQVRLEVDPDFWRRKTGSPD